MTTVFALGCHPDDIEFMMAGTLFLLKEAGCRLHTMNLASGNCGSTALGAEEIVTIRREESLRAAAVLGSAHHESLANDIEVFYEDGLIRRVAAIIRRVAPDIVLLPSPEDYMEDHMNTSRIGVTAAFCRGMPNYRSIPEVPAIDKEVVLYHALPYGLTDGLRRRIEPDLFVDISVVIDAKERMLACHQSQRRWLDESQGLDSYIRTMRDMSAEVGRMSGRFTYAEGWRRHSHLGFSREDRGVLEDFLEGLSLAR
jgi:LmbE family N-acetylglucosaminyl deacetylase